MRFFQRFFHSTPSTSVLRELPNPGGCLGTPPAPPAPPAPAGRPPSFWLPRNPQFRDLSQRGIEGPDVFTTLRVTGDVTLNSDVMQLVIPNDIIQTTINSAISKSTIDSTVYPNTYRCLDREYMYTVSYDVTRTRIDRSFQSLTIIH